MISQDEQKDTQKQLFSKLLKIKQDGAKIEADFWITLIPGWGELFSQ